MIRVNDFSEHVKNVKVCDFRAELEATYAKGLSKLSSKLTKACAKDQGEYQLTISANFTSY